jgi:adenosine deaminase/aminodeoxyfutalosine deaminase
VAVGIGGDEARGPAEWFRDLYKKAADNGLRLTAHAGETTGPESVWGALNIGAERIGHGLSAARDPELLEVMAQKQVPVELCITSNLRTGACAELKDHPVRKFFDDGLMVTLNSDDPAMFQTSLNKEYEIAQQEFNFSEEHLRELARNSIEASFLPVERKLKLLSQIDFLV